jgi:Fur family peroxide stress response transcriptional regulator
MLSVQEFIDTCREKGLNVTYQRILIYKSLIKTKTHPTAEEIYHEVKSEYPSISLATVYKTLETLAEHDLIAKVTPLHDLARYDGDITPHHHLVCLECKKIIDIYDEPLNHLKLPSHDSFQVFGYRIQFEGICNTCAQQQASKERGRGEEDNVTFCGKN